jgi:hypothetical protein
MRNPNKTPHVVVSYEAEVASMAKATAFRNQSCINGTKQMNISNRTDRKRLGVLCCLLFCVTAIVWLSGQVGADPLPQPIRLEISIQRVSRLAISPDGKSLAIAGLETIDGSREGVIYLCRADSGEQITRLLTSRDQDRPAHHLTDAVFTPDSKHIVTANGGTVQMWDIENGREIAVLRKSSEPGSNDTRISISPSGHLLAVFAGRLEFYDLKTHEKVRTFETESWGAIAFADETSLLSAEYHNLLHRWDFDSDRPIAEVHPMMGILHEIEVSPDRKLAAVAGGGIQLFEILSESPHLQKRYDLAGQIGEGGSVSFARSGNLLATGGGEGTVRLWDYQKAELRGMLWWDHTRKVAKAAISPDGSLLLVSRLVSEGGPSNPVTEIYTVADLVKPNRIKQVVLSAAESLRRDLLDNKKQEPNWATMMVLAGPHAEPAVPVMKRLLSNDDLLAKDVAIRILGEIGPGARDALEEIRSIAESTDPKFAHLKFSADNAIRKISREVDRR